MRRSPFIALLISFLLIGAAPASPQPDAVAGSCAGIYAFERFGPENTNNYILALDSATSQTAHAAVTMYDGRTGYTADLPAVPLTIDVNVQHDLKRSAAILLHLPVASEHPTILVHDRDALSTCTASGRASFTRDSTRRDDASKIHDALLSEAATAIAVQLVADPAQALTCDKPLAAATAVLAVPPQYPAAARAMRAGGTTLVTVTLAASGSAETAKVYRSSGNEYLDDASVQAALASTYNPEIVDCEAVPGAYIFRADFSSQ